MKKFLLLCGFLLGVFFNSLSQCSTIFTTALPLTAQNAGTPFTSQAGKYAILNITAGKTYEIKSSSATQNFCVREGSYNSATIVAQGGMNGSATGLVYTAQSTGTAYIHIYTQACNTSATNRTITITDISTTYGTASSLTYTQGFNSTTMPISNWYAYTINMGTTTAAQITGIASGSNPTSTPYEGADYIRFNSYSCDANATARLVSPAITTTGTASVDVEFYLGQDNSYSASNDYVQLQYSTNGNTWTNAGSVFYRYSATAGASNSWVKNTVTLPAGAGNQSKVYIGFLFTSAFGAHMSLDKVTILQTPSCLAPTSPTIIATSSTSANLSWTASASSPSGGYEWEVRTSGAGGSGATGLTASGSVAAGVTTASTSALTQNTTYTLYVRSNCGSSTYSSWAASSSVTTPLPPAPSNDLCSGAISLTVNSTPTCTTSSSGTTLYATQSLSAVGGYGTADDDVWYTFTATNAKHIITVTPGTLTNAVVQVFSGNCSGVTSIGVVDATSGSSPEVVICTGLTIGVTYYVRVYAKANGTGQGTFTICVTTPPVNDEVTGSITLIVNDPYITDSNLGATSSTTAPTPTGPAYYGGDVWYKFVVPSGGSVQILTKAGTLTDIVMEVYSGTTSSLTSVTYNDDSLYLVQSMPYIALTGLTPGQTMYIRVWDYFGDQTGDFQIRVITPIALPIELISFEGFCFKDRVFLNWKTASEHNNNYFSIDKSQDGYVWTNFAIINGAGNTTMPVDYSYEDLNPYRGIGYYKLSQTDFNGETEQFNIISVSCVNEFKDNVIAYPNPATNEFNILINNSIVGDLNITISDSKGSIVYSIKTGEKIIKINSEDWSRGVYILTVFGDIVETIKITLE